MRPLRALGAGLILALSLVWPGPARAETPLEAFVSIAPQKYFVHKIGGPLVRASVMVPAGASPATYEPRPQQMAALARARLYLAIGVPFEQAWLPRIAAANRSMQVVHTEAGIERQAMAAHDHEEGQAKEHEHEHGPGLDPHVWLAPRLVMIQAAAIRRALVEAAPEQRAAFEANAAAFQAELASLDAELKAAFQGLGGRNNLMVFHPAWGYFAEAYGLKQIAIEQEGKEPGARGLKRLIEQARALDVKVIFVQPQFSSRQAEAIAQSVGAKVIPIDPLAEDWTENLRRVAGTIRQALK